ncbi:MULTISPECIES: sulfurtransferase complex subunit TusC [Pasteurellaceae]|uniref:Sulfur relay protein TusC/DsrF n=1 Tax=Pasteurella bettyae CCUG 2042 TaxID=1095749 RepID=I3DDT1_9PAST|nr:MULTISPECIES: sulfurtransferase complex subunit TusC [Pasteurellaceae]EIJ69874.1 sulfur relay protein TusC/DsrF [Pasteurella bettyae CCUG 2042]SUB22982.1 protein TusC [Pasteurella bettyae]
MKLAFVFRHSPHGSTISREGLDALLAASAFCDENKLAVFFIDDGVLNLLPHQQPEIILQKDFISGFKLLDLYDIEQRYICSESLNDLGLINQALVINCEKIDRTLFLQKLQKFEKIITF